MTSSHLAYNVSVDGAPYRAVSIWRQAAAVHFPYGFMSTIAFMILFSEDF